MKQSTKDSLVDFIKGCSIGAVLTPIIIVFIFSAPAIITIVVFVACVIIVTLIAFSSSISKPSTENV